MTTEAERRDAMRAHNAQADRRAPDLTYDETYGPGGPLEGRDTFDDYFEARTIFAALDEQRST